MILLDPNVVSEAMKASPADNVLTWLNEEDSDRHYVSAITIGEIFHGLRILPDGKRRTGLSERFEQFIALVFDQRVLAYDDSAARAYSELMGHREALGRPMRVPDGQIVAIARPTI